MPLPIPANPEWPSDVAGTDELSCKVAGEFFATWMTTPEQIDAGIYRGPGLVVTAGYLRVLLGGYAQQYSDADLVKLFFELQVRAEENDPSFSYQAFINDYIQPAVSACGGSVCKSLGWGGNSDLAGIGVLSSYYIEAVLATVFLIALLIKRSKQAKGAFRDTLPDLLLGVFVFSFAVMAASLYGTLKAQGEPDSVTTYDVTTGVLVTVFSVCPPTLLYCQNERFLSESKGGRRTVKFILRVALFALWALMLVVVNLGLQSDPSKEALAAGKMGHPFEVYCQVIGTAPLQAVRIFAVASAGLGVLWVGYLVLAGKRGQDSTGEKKNRWPAVVSVLACVAMWLFLVSFTVLRARIIDVAGDSDKSNEWGFGQIVALAAWVPVILRFFYVMFFDDE